MAGSFLSIDLLGQQQIAQTLKQIYQRSEDLTPALSEVGEYLLDLHAQRFIDQTDPDGNTWAALQPATLANARRPDRILRESGTLADTLTYQIGEQQLRFGTNLEYGAAHQFGRDEINLPPRPWLGLNDAQSQSVLEILTHYLQE